MTLAANKKRNCLMRTLSEFEADKKNRRRKNQLKDVIPELKTEI